MVPVQVVGLQHALLKSMGFVGALWAWGQAYFHFGFETGFLCVVLECSM